MAHWKASLLLYWLGALVLRFRYIFVVVARF